MCIAPISWERIVDRTLLFKAVHHNYLSGRFVISSNFYFFDFSIISSAYISKRLRFVREH